MRRTFAGKLGGLVFLWFIANPLNAEVVSDLARGYQAWASMHRAGIKQHDASGKFRVYLLANRNLSYPEILRLAALLKKGQLQNLPEVPLTEAEAVALYFGSFTLSFDRQISQDFSGFAPGGPITVNLSSRHADFRTVLEVLAQSPTGRSDLARFLPRAFGPHPDLHLQELTASVRRRLSVPADLWAIFSPAEQTVFLDLTYSLGELAIQAGHEIFHAIDPVYHESERRNFRRAEDLRLIQSHIATTEIVNRSCLIRYADDELVPHIIQEERITILPNILRIYPNEILEWRKLLCELDEIQAIENLQRERRAYEQHYTVRQELEGIHPGARRYYQNGNPLEAVFMPERVSDEDLIEGYVRLEFRDLVRAFLKSGESPPPLSDYSNQLSRLLTTIHEIRLGEFFSPNAVVRRRENRMSGLMKMTPSCAGRLATESMSNSETTGGRD